MSKQTKCQDILLVQNALDDGYSQVAWNTIVWNSNFYAELWAMGAIFWANLKTIIIQGGEC